jgi:RNA polymerase sigma-70 factor (ECF subfamily)
MSAVSDGAVVFGGYEGKTFRMFADLKSAYLLHSPELTRYVRRRAGDRNAVADVVHDAFVRMAEQPATKIQDVRSYLYRIARNLLLDQKKQDVRRQTFAVPHEALFDIVDDAPSPEDAVDARLKLERLQRLVTELPFKTQQIFVLNRVDGLSYVEVARHLDISESSVQKHLALAVQHIASRPPSR